MDKKPKIEIKKSHVGRFTSYCGGNVTDSCISKGLGSPSKEVRAMAQFALNSKSFNHSKGNK